MVTVCKDGYVFEVDVEKTKDYYKSHSLCECEYCQTFYSQIDGKFPKLEQFLSEFGVDVKKPDETFPLEEETVVDYIQVDYTVCGKVTTMGKYEIDIYDGLFLSISVTDGFVSPNEQKGDYFTFSVFGIELPSNNLSDGKKKLKNLKLRLKKNNSVK